MVYLPCQLCRVRETDCRASRACRKTGRGRAGRFRADRFGPAAGASGPVRGSAGLAPREQRLSCRGLNEAMNEPICVNYAQAREQIRTADLLLFRRRNWYYAADRRGRPVGIRSRGDGRLVERPADVRGNDFRRRAGTTAVEPGGVLAGRDRRVSGQRGGPAFFPRTGLGNDDRHHRQAIWLGQSVSGRFAALARVSVLGPT